MIRSRQYSLLMFILESLLKQLLSTSNVLFNRFVGLLRQLRCLMVEYQTIDPYLCVLFRTINNMHSPTCRHTNQGAPLRSIEGKSFKLISLQGDEPRSTRYRALQPQKHDDLFSPTRQARISLSPDFMFVVIYEHGFHLPENTETACVTTQRSFCSWTEDFLLSCSLADNCVPSRCTDSPLSPWKLLGSSGLYSNSFLLCSGSFKDKTAAICRLKVIRQEVLTAISAWKHKLRIRLYH